MLPASARRNAGIGTGAAAAVPPSPAASSTTCSPTRSSSAASGIGTRSIPASIPRSWTRRSGRRSRIASRPTGRAGAYGVRRRTPSPLAGRLFDPDGRKMRPSHARKKGRCYRYYVSAGLVEGSVATGATGWRIPAREIEAAVGCAVAARLREPGFLSEILHFSGVRSGGIDQAHRPHLGVGGPARCTGIGGRSGGDPAAGHPGRALPVRTAGGGKSRTAE